MVKRRNTKVGQEGMRGHTREKQSRGDKKAVQEENGVSDGPILETATDSIYSPQSRQ